MLIKQIYTGCLSEAAYFIESNGEAAVIDPLRDVDSYITLAKECNASIKYIFETHFHADFVSGHLDLTKKTGAPIVYGPGAETQFPTYKATDGEIFKIGHITLQAIHTPGHTLESTCYLLMDEKGQAHCLFSGDTLFVGDVGRPDLSSGDKTSEELADILYDTIQQKILPLADEIIVYPAHGAGSSCGKNLGKETFSTIGLQKQTNYALQPLSREDFIKVVTEGLGFAPKYFPINAKINMEGYADLDLVKATGMTPLSISAFKSLQERAIVLDTRHASIFTRGFIPGSIFIGLEGRFAEWAGSLLPFDKPLILITEKGKEEESVIRLARVGFDKMMGVLEGGFEAWQQAGEKTDLVIDVEADELAMDIPFDPNLVVVDVRRDGEFAEGHVKDSVNLPLQDMTDLVHMSQFEEKQNLYVHCAGGYRSVIAISMMKQQGYHNLRNVVGGWNSIKEEKRILTEKEASVLN